MKSKYIVLILIILAIVIGGLYLKGAFSPLIKEDFGDKKFSVPQGFKVSEKAKNTVKMSNGTHHLTLEKLGDAELNSAVQNYTHKYEKNYTINVSDVDLGNKKVIKKTQASQVNNDSSTTVLTKYWFTDGKSVYDIQTLNDTASMEPISKDIIRSFQ